MIKIVNGKFQKHGLSFSPPDGYYYESNPETIHEDGIVFVSEDGSKTLNFDFLICRYKSCNSLDHLFERDFLGYINFNRLTAITPILFNGLLGHHVLYKGSDSPDEPATQYYEIHFDLGECEDGNILFALRVNDFEGDIVNYVQSDEFQRILFGVSKTEE